MSTHTLKPVVIAEHEDFIVLNKPAGLLSVPDRMQSEVSLKDLLLQQYREIFTVHRLDKGTSGVIVFARHADSHKALSQLFEARETEKIYLGLVHGIPLSQSGTIDAPMMQHPGKETKMVVHTKGKPSVTEYEVLEQFRLYAWMQFNILTGRMHQIRVHMQHIGHPIVCDDIYGKPDPVLLSSIKRKFHLSKNEEAERPLLSRLALHAAQLKFTLNGKSYAFEAELPKDLKATLQQLRKWGN